MSLPVVTGTGRLISEPNKGTKNGKPWCNSVIRFVGFRKDGEQWIEDSSFAAAIVGFNDAARALAQYHKGDEVQITGRIRSLSIWQPDRGDPRPELELRIDEVSAPERRSRNSAHGDDRPARQRDEVRDARPARQDRPTGPGATITSLRQHAEQRHGRAHDPRTGRPA